MKEKNNIGELMDKLHDGQLSHEESEKLFSKFKLDYPDEQISEFYRKEWENSPTSGSTINYKQILQKIHKHFEFGNRSSKKSRIQLNSWLKYAAIFIIAFLGSWFLNNLINSKSIEVPRAQVENIITVSYGSKSEIQLPDGSKVKLNSGSSLSYPAIFNDKNRTVKLSGEGYFEVHKDQSRPFYVNTSSIAVKVLGTTFNVKAYPDENFIETTLISGEVEIYNEIKTEGKSLKKDPIAVLKPNNKATFVKDLNKLMRDQALDNRLLEKKEKPVKFLIEKEIDTELYTAWKDNVLKFNNEYFTDIIIKLERWYDVKIEMNCSKLKKERFTGQFDSETIEQALNAISLTEPFKYKIDKNKITIYN